MAAITYTARRGLSLLGDEVGAWMADTTAETLVGAELVTNGGFATDTDWTKGTGWSIGSGVASHTGGAGYLSQTVATVANKAYLLEVEVVSITDAISIRWDGTVVGFPTATGVYVYTVTATGTSADVEVYDDNNCSVDNVSVRLAVPDLSTAANGLGIYGSITKAAVATGADLVAHSGFSTSNYLEQPYNSDLDTNYPILATWVKISTALTRSIIQRSYYSSGYSGAIVILRITSNGYPSFYISDDAGATADTAEGTTSIADDNWHFVVGFSDGTYIYLYIDGVLISTTIISNALGSLTNTNAILNIGVDPSYTYAFNGSVALSRILDTGNTITAAQIKAIYNSEKHLFEPYATYTQVGESYSFDLDLSTRDMSRRSDREVNQPIEGAQEVLLFDDRREFNVTSALKSRAQISELNEFLTSAMDGHIFTFDPYGTAASSDTPLSCQLDQNDFSEAREGSTDYLAVSFKVREVT